MYRRVLQLFLYMLCINTEDVLLGASRKFVHQRDISEHCKRRVVPSVFLGRHVMDANSQIMQFSQLEAPYSCSLSVRAEAGSNIILIVQLLSEDSLTEACNLNGDQLIVYELGETFGGYWGPIPNVLMKESAKNYTQYYTLKRTKPSTHRTQKPQSTVKKILMETETQSTVTEQQYYTMDVPIVNVSGNFQLGPRRETNDSEDLFNYIYDVMPRTGVEYETSIMPLVQFSIRQLTNGYEGEDHRYELDYDSKGFTMDPRLLFNTVKKKKTSFRKNWKANRRFPHRLKSTSMFRRDSKKLVTVPSPFIDEAFNTFKPSIPTLDSSYLTNPWGLVNGIIKSMNLTTVRSTVFQNKTHRHIIDKISNSHHNSSVYLSRNISIYNVDISTKESKTVFQDGDDSTQFVSSSKIDENKTKGVAMPEPSLLHTSVQTSSPASLELDKLKIEYDLESKNDKIEVYNITDEINMTADKLSAKNELLTEITTVPSTTRNKMIKTSFRTGAMVDHESWENIVQAAPVMAVVLNNTEPQINNTITNVFNKRKHKRSIQSLEIERSRPRNLTTRRALVSDTPPLEDIHDMARLVELEDDEMGSRVALRYLRHYAGRAVYRLCDHRQQSLTQTFLFNSSRIIIAVSNFTLDRMMIVLTPAQTLQSGVSQCPEGQLECQVVGTRVCIDSLNACDGVPNCGSYEIYDEERLRCGARGGRRGAAVGALTLLGVVLTAGYIALYWLQRCVPRVSDAFFIYTDSSENELLLDSIMRSPNDDEDPSNKMNYLGHFFDDDVLYQDLNAEEKNVHICKKMFKACWKLLGFRKIQNPPDKVNTENQIPTREASKMFSFTQLELKKFGKIQFKEQGVQTGDSFEIQELSNQQNKKEVNSLSSFIKFKAAISNQHERRQDSELNLIKFSKESRSLSSQSDFVPYEHPNSVMRRHAVGIGTEREIEIENTLYEHVPKPLNTTKIPVTYEVHTETKKTVDSSKRLRFDEELKMISNIEEDEDDWAADSSTSKRHNNEDLDKIVEVQEPEGSSRDFMRFWGAKGKKDKKKKLKSLYGKK